VNKIVADGMVIGETRARTKIPPFLKAILVTDNNKVEYWPQYEIELVGKSTRKAKG
jgi:hypothetical protein